MDKKQSRLRRARKTRARIAEQKQVRLTVYRSNTHIYAQIIAANGSEVLAAASSLDKDVRTSLSNGGNIKAAELIGQRIAEKAKAAGVTQVAFDRSGFQYHGRIKALADAARANGLEF
ncbi:MULTISPECIES: 50S ribosomal protein L18 [Leeia]|uniref:Large ribosomal subunit protein uL18 n=1 Tax=Leeia aquatica TaxID=2725557 RepID=A0A847RYM0_9NEIS|nr:50S ribosomal protein L18 [Leeia aquatica]NLR74811.1 50S ribosomal protein L18 [Leeia aquatica]